MAGVLVLVVGGIYALTAVFYFRENNIGMAIAFAAYALANVGLYMAGEK